MNECPYCQSSLLTPMKRKGLCPFCGKMIFVRNSNMVTEYKANKVDWLKRVDWLGIGESMIDHTHSEQLERFKQEPLFNDICWSILNKSLLRTIDDIEKQKSIYLEMAHILEIEGKDNREIIAKAGQIYLNKAKREGKIYVRTGNCNDNLVCKCCRKMANEKIPIDIAIIENPIPFRCENKYCRCWYM